MIPLRQNLRAAGMLSLTMALFCSGDTASKIVLQHLPVGELTFIRAAFVCALLLLVRLGCGSRAGLWGAVERTTLLRALLETGVVLAFYTALRIAARRQRDDLDVRIADHHDRARRLRAQGAGGPAALGRRAGGVPRRPDRRPADPRGLESRRLSMPCSARSWSRPAT